MRSVRAVRDTPGADYSAPGISTMCRIAYRSPIAVSPFLLALSVSYFKQTLWRCGQLWPSVGMGSFGTHLHRDCNADPGVKRHHRIIRNTHSIFPIFWSHSVFPQFCGSTQLHDPRGWVVSYLLTLILCSSSQVDSWSWHGEIERDDLTSCS